MALPSPIATVNSISKAAILAAVCFFAISACWQAYHDACHPTALYAACRIRAHFYFGWLERYQTLIGGLLALGGAWWAASAVYAQIRQAEEAEQARLESKRAAARAVLPLALSAICEYAEDCVIMLQGLLKACSNEVLPDTALRPEKLPEIPADAFTAMRDMTEAARPYERDTLAALLENIQVQRSTIGAVSQAKRGTGRPVLAIQIEGLIVDSLEVYARAISLFEFSRRIRDRPPSATLTRQQMMTALHLMRDYDDGSPIAKAVERRFTE